MRPIRSLWMLAVLAGSVHTAHAQQPRAGGPLTLDDAIATAQRNNPAFQQVRNNVRTADAQVRSAYGALLPSAGGSFQTAWQQGGTQYVQGVALPGGSADTYNGSYRAGVQYTLNAGLAFAPRAAKATRSATEADVTSQSAGLRSQVTTQYIVALQAEAQAALQDSLFATAQGQLDLANAKVAAGGGTILEVRTAEVAVGQVEVNALTQHNLARIEKLRLFQVMGVPADMEAALTTTFAVAQPTFSLDSLLDLARRVNPDLAARKSRQAAAQAGVRLAQTSYLPSLTISSGYGGNSFGYVNPEFVATRAVANTASAYQDCLALDSLRAGAGLAPVTCGTGTLTPEQLDVKRASNKPFRFDKAPYSISAFVSIPIFNNFQREQTLEVQRVARDNAVNDVRARSLQLTTDVTQAYLNLVTGARTVELQARNAAKASEELAFADESYRVGAKAFLDLTTARGTYEQAQINRVNAIYEYHKAFAALENAVGRPLR